VSYCRSNGNDSDVYLIGTCFDGEWYLDCMGAGWKMEEEKPVHDKIMCDSYEIKDDRIVKTGGQHEMAGSFYSSSRSEMIDHLLVHRGAGHMVPDYAIQRLQDEIAEHGDDYNKGNR